MTDRTITPTPTEAEKFTALAVGESMWIVRAGTFRPSTRPGGMEGIYDPPVEFVQACAPCETCEGSRLDDAWCGTVCRDMGCTERECPPRCSECKLAVHPPCRRCGGGGQDTTRIIPTQCFVCSGTGRGYPLGYAYAVGEPLPMVGYLPTPPHRDCVEVGNDGMIVWRREPGAYGGQAWRATHHPADALARYGPPETLPGQWAIEVRKA